MARIISISNHKGGVGKTTIAANLGFSIARYFKVLLVDLDSQANLTSGLGFYNKEEGIGRYLREVIHFRSPEVVPLAINDYVHLIPGRVDLLTIEQRLHETTRNEFILKEILAPIKNNYDIIILDCPPSFNLLTINALTCSNLILIPAKPEIFSINGISLIQAFANERQIPFKIIFNQVNERSLLHKKVISKAVSEYTGHLLTHSIRNTIALAEAFEHAQDIFHYRNTSSGASDFTKVADELFAVI
jgi:chromosome partitioning protein